MIPIEPTAREDFITKDVAVFRMTSTWTIGQPCATSETVSGRFSNLHKLSFRGARAPLPPTHEQTSFIRAFPDFDDNPESTPTSELDRLANIRKWKVGDGEGGKETDDFEDG